MKRLSYIFILFVVVLSSACNEYDSDINIKDGESKLVLNAFISPDDTRLRISVTQTIPTIGRNIDPIVRDAVVTISDGITTDTLAFELNEFLYTSQTDIKPGTKYTVRAVTPDGRWAEASCTTLQDVVLDFNYTIDSQIVNNRIEYTVTMNWIDNSNSPNTYYRSDAELYYLVFDTINMTYNFITTELKPDKSEIMQGMGFNQPMEIIYKSNFELRNIEKYLELHLLMIDEDYYNFEINKRNNSSSFPNYEYSKIYSNVVNGFGIVASYHNHVLKPLNIN